MSTLDPLSHFFITAVSRSFVLRNYSPSVYSTFIRRIMFFYHVTLALAGEMMSEVTWDFVF